MIVWPHVGTADLFDIDVNLSDNAVHQAALYFLDWDSTTRIARSTFWTPPPELFWIPEPSRNLTRVNTGYGI